ncbi:MAG: hypothetical protein HYV07_30220 [Deltaproteobacteria bacterium]|nr:hypothetical protein [Deltaproteobacteria bacterium]
MTVSWVADVDAVGIVAVTVVVLHAARAGARVRRVALAAILVVDGSRCVDLAVRPAVASSWVADVDAVGVVSVAVVAPARSARAGAVPAGPTRRDGVLIVGVGGVVAVRIRPGEEVVLAFDLDLVLASGEIAHTHGLVRDRRRARIGVGRRAGRERRAHGS